MIYADNAATTRISEYVLEKMIPFLTQQYGNPSSGYSFGHEANLAIAHARKQFADAIHCLPDEIIFTSGGTESNNQVLFGIARQFSEKKGHMITSAIEHPAVMRSCLELEKMGFRITYLPVDQDGVIKVSDVERAICPDTRLVSVMFGNNEIGSLQPIAEIGRLVAGRPILFHTDAVQVFGQLPIDVKELGVHFLTGSAHKFHGPKGVGILYKQKGISLPPFLYGGGQEGSMRAGTENVAGIVGAGYAIEESGKLLTNKNNVYDLAKMTMEKIEASLPLARFNSRASDRLPGIVSVTLEGVSGEALMHILDLKGVCISTGSACSSGTKEISHVLRAIGLTRKQAESTIRISYGIYNTPEEADTIVRFICESYHKLASL